jgi:hypothetical protein
MGSVSKTAGLWWDLGHPEASGDVARAIRENALVWLDRFASHGDILRIFEEGGRIAVGMHPAAPLDIADVYLALGKHIEARKILTRYVAEDHAPGHSAYVAKFVEDRGFPDLIARLTSTD